MAEIYRNTTSPAPAASFTLTGATLTKVEFARNGEIIDGGTTSPAAIPYSIIHVDGDFEVIWTYTIGGDEYELREEHAVVTPLFSIAELKEFNTQFTTLSDAKITELERLCRNIIEVHTGQTFGYEHDIMKVRGSGDTVLLFDRRIISINSVAIEGYQFGQLPYTYRPIKNGFGIQQYLSAENTVLDSVIPITDPRSPGYMVFRENAPYYVDGFFGYVSPPADIKQAALLLAEEFSCKEATWRDRYLRAVTAADWRFDFHDKAFIGTGSVVVDQILAKYKVSNMAVI